MHTHKMDVPQYQKLEGCGGLLALQHQEIAPNVFLFGESRHCQWSVSDVNPTIFVDIEY